MQSSVLVREDSLDFRDRTWFDILLGTSKSINGFFQRVKLEIRIELMDVWRRLIQREAVLNFE
jgi:hypothetical protein